MLSVKERMKAHEAQAVMQSMCGELIAVLGARSVFSHALTARLRPASRTCTCSNVPYMCTWCGGLQLTGLQCALMLLLPGALNSTRVDHEVCGQGQMLLVLSLLLHRLLVHITLPCMCCKHCGASLDGPLKGLHSCHGDRSRASPLGALLRTCTRTL